MGGGLIQLVAYGAQDVYLTGNPQITFFKTIYKRHTNFSIESVEQIFDGNINFGRSLTCNIARKGDLLSQVFLRIKLPDMGKIADTNIDGDGNEQVCSWVNGIGHYIIDTCEIEIGGQLVDRQYGEWLEIWCELTLSKSKENGYNTMVGRHASDPDKDSQTKGLTLNIPLQFWFCKNVGLSLPLIALQYHEVKINVKLNKFENMYYSGYSKEIHGTTPSQVDILEGSLYCDYIFLDTEERRRFAQSSHEYLIEQLQYTGGTGIPSGTKSMNIPIILNHPVKELVWVIQSENAKKWNRLNTYTLHSHITEDKQGTNNTTILPPLEDARLQLNGIDRFSTRDEDYFRLVQPYQRHSRIPEKEIYVYSFALKPEEHQPSGTCNFSRIDNSVMQISLKKDSKPTDWMDDVGSDNMADEQHYAPGFDDSCEFRLYALNYNILRVMSGMGGIAYSN